MNDPVKELENALGHAFQNRQLLEQALTHPSLARTRLARKSSNQRMEFLGDRVLGLVIADMLYDAYPNEEEGAMARRHTALVRSESLSRVADQIGLASYIHLGSSEEDAGGRNNPALLADACEAVIAAIYLDAGMEPADTFIRRYWQPMMEENTQPPQDAKTALQEYAQGKGMTLPCYQEISRSGPAHDPVFTIEVSIKGHSPATATGNSKRVAEQAAATLLLNELQD